LDLHPEFFWTFGKVQDANGTFVAADIPNDF